jgi:hypothetical protein
VVHLILAAVLTATPALAPAPKRTPRAGPSYLLTKGQFRPGEFNTYRNDRCGLSFSYPTTWEVFTDLENRLPGQCVIRLRPTDWGVSVAHSESELPDHAVEVTTSQEAWATGIRSHGFELRDGHWVYRGGTIFEQRPEMILGAAWQGLEVTDMTKQILKAGGSAAAQLTSIYLGTPTQFVSVSASVPDVDEYVFYSLIRSLALHFATPAK